MVDRLPAWLFLSLALILISFALLPVARVIIGMDAQIAIQPLTMVMLLIRGIVVTSSDRIVELEESRFD